MTARSFQNPPRVPPNRPPCLAGSVDTTTLSSQPALNAAPFSWTCPPDLACGMMSRPVIIGPFVSPGRCHTARGPPTPSGFFWTTIVGRGALSFVIRRVPFPRFQNSVVSDKLSSSLIFPPVLHHLPLNPPIPLPVPSGGVQLAHIPSFANFPHLRFFPAPPMLVSISFLRRSPHRCWKMFPSLLAWCFFV